MEEYDVKIYIYDDDGRLVESKNFNKVKQIILRTREIRVSRQIFYEQLALVIDSDSPRIEYREGGILYISN